jgi:predicted nucleic acid-binding protein
VRLVIADTGPVNYLIPIGHIDLLPRMFERVVLPAAVRDELSRVAGDRKDASRNSFHWNP